MRCCRDWTQRQSNTHRQHNPGECAGDWQLSAVTDTKATSHCEALIRWASAFRLVHTTPAAPGSLRKQFPVGVTKTQTSLRRHAVHMGALGAPGVRHPSPGREHTCPVPLHTALHFLTSQRTAVARSEPGIDIPHNQQQTYISRTGSLTFPRTKILVYKDL